MTQFSTSEVPSSFVSRTCAPMVSYFTFASTGYIIQSRPTAIGTDTPLTCTRSSVAPSVGIDSSEQQAERHRGEDPERQEAVERREATQDGRVEIGRGAARRQWRAGGGGDAHDVRGE